MIAKTMPFLRQNSPAGMNGFTLGEAAHFLASEWKVERGLILAALWQDFSSGVFDPSESLDAADMTVEIKSSELETRPELREAISNCWLLIAPDLDRIPEKSERITVLTSRGAWVLWAHGWRFGHRAESDLLGNIVITSGAIGRFCKKRGRAAPSFLSARRSIVREVAKQDVYAVLKEIASDTQRTKHWLAEEVGRRLGKRVTPSMRGFIEAVNDATSERLIRTRPQGRPRGTPKTGLLK
jgi:hypothetical protein